MHSEPLFPTKMLADPEGSFVASKTNDSKAEPKSPQKFDLDPYMAEGKVIANILSDFSCKTTKETEFNFTERLGEN